MEDLKKYLEIPEHERDFHVGVALYDTYGKNMRMKNVTFQTRLPIPAIRNTLMYELTKILQQEFGQIAIVKEPELTQDQEDAKPEIVVLSGESSAGFLKKEFPTLNYDTLTDELKILLFDRINLFHRAKAAREKLFDKTLSEQELYEANRENVECRIANIEIWNELNAFAKTGKPLGKHVVFLKKRERERLQNLDRTDLHKIIQNAASYYSKQNKLIIEAAENGNIERVTDLRNKITFREWQVQEAAGLLGINL